MKKRWRGRGRKEEEKLMVCVCGENQIGKHRQHHSAVTCRTSYCVDYSTLCYYYYGYF